MLRYLQHMSQQFLEGLVLPIAQEAVCVQRVLMAIKAQLHYVPHILNFLLSHKRYLGRRTAEVKRSHRGPVWAEPVPHKTILQKKEEGQQLQKTIS